jgi:hypothetical protein
MDQPQPILFDLLLNAPPHVSRRCGAHARTTGQPCKRWATIGCTRCRMHGGAKGSGRPPTTGLRTKERQRQESFLAFTRFALARHHERPEPVDPPPEVLAAMAAAYGPGAVVAVTDEEDDD